MPSDIIKRICIESKHMQSQWTMWFRWCIMVRFVHHSQTPPVGPCLLANIQYRRSGWDRCLNLGMVVAIKTAAIRPSCRYYVVA